MTQNPSVITIKYYVNDLVFFIYLAMWVIYSVLQQSILR